MVQTVQLRLSYLCDVVSGFSFGQVLSRMLPLLCLKKPVVSSSALAEVRCSFEGETQCVIKTSSTVRGTVNTMSEQVKQSEQNMKQNMQQVREFG
jgi:hypothetical protein